jgi:hypothetical protein
MKNHDQKLKILDLINEKILNRATEERYRLMQASRGSAKKKWIPILAASRSAAVLLSVVAIFLVPLLLKQVPVYTGMTVSNQSPFEVAYAGDAQYEQLAATGTFEGNHVGAEKKPTKKPNLQKEVKDTLQVEGASQPLYYANPKEDVYITVHIENPDQYEILSFTLNGKKYSSYMLEEGSDMENLVLKVNVGDVEGIVEYTIDAIKYVDGTEIKDVKMEGDQTVKIGVKPKKGVSVKIEKETFDYDTISFTAMLSDSKKLIELFEGKVEAVLYTDGELVARKDLAVNGSTEVVFDDLHSGIEYQYAIVAHYDPLDGKGFGSYILQQKAILLEAGILFDNVEITQTSLSFSLAWNEILPQKELVSISLYRNGEKLQTLAPDATNVSDLLSGEEYQLIAEYHLKGRVERSVLTFTTAEKTVPEVLIKELTRSVQMEKYLIRFGVVMQDPDQIATIQSVSLYQGESFIANSDNYTNVQFDALDVDLDYTIKITYSYDLNDGKGIQTQILTKTVFHLISTGTSISSQFDNDSDGEGDVFYFSNYLPYEFTSNHTLVINPADYDQGTSYGVKSLVMGGFTHYYLDLNEDNDYANLILNLNFEVPEDGYYAICFQLRLKDDNQRGNEMYIDGELVYEMDFQLDAETLEMVCSDSETMNSYMSGFGVNLTAGKHILSMKPSEYSVKTFHFRYIYLVKVSE